MRRKVNIIVIFNHNKSKLLMCKRRKDPYQGKYNFVGGKIKPDENHLEAAYRELKEETGITKQDVSLTHFMDFTYYLDDTLLETYVGIINEDIEVYGDENELVWIDLDEDFKDDNRFAGDGNIYHILKVLALSNY
ncbi:NUDIX hydrolase [uncultured Thomasclavelia sp.]|uniref:NUDIX hydrolase n=1 Tax=uncultured Thomasclavelia sp. TaxID=3025759 RepID=UPI0025F41747|nr:NUDIX domain-containing protein [uncultured Thomasclavelia sp.]